MKKLFTKLMAVTALVLLSVWSAEAQNVEIGYEATTSWPAVSTVVVNQLFNSATVSEFNIATEAGSVKSATVCGTSNVVHYELGGTAHLLEGKLTANSATSKISKIRFKGSTNGSTATAAGVVYSSVYPFDANLVVGAVAAPFPASSGAWVDIDVTPPANAKSFRIYRRIYYNASTGKSQTSSGTGFAQYGDGTTIRLAYVGAWIDPIDPSVVISSGSNPAAAMETLEMTPVVYAYTNVADAANVTANWYADNTYTTTTSAPANLSIVKDTDAKTVTISGTPTTAGTYYYKVAVNETGGNAIEGSVVVSAYVTPAPVITLISGSANQTVKAGTSVADIVYTIQYATGASVEGLPANVIGTYDNGTYIISGTVGAGVTPGAFNFTVTPTALSGYVGDAVSAAGSVSVKSATAKEILYLTGTAAPDAKDTQLYPMLNNNVNYIVTVKQAASSAPASTFYDAFDLIVLNEIVAGANVEAIALKSVNKPILNLKSFVYSTGRWGWGTGNNGLANNGTVAVAQPTHPIFAGITLNEGSLELLSGAATKGVQPADVTIGGITVATAPKEASGTAVAIHDVPASVREVESAKYLMVALCNDSYDKMTANALTLLANSVDYLLNGIQFVPVSTSVPATVDVSGISFDGRVIRNANREEVSVFNTTGRLVVRSMEDINMSVQPKGIYFVHTSKGTIKIALTK